jgi:hypothetical protein
MSKPNRKFARRKAQNDRRARNQQAQAERKIAMKNQAVETIPAAAPEMEVRDFTEAELKALNKKMKVFNDARDDVNEFLSFLQEQHGIGKGEGWNMGEKGFFRPLPPTPSTNGNGEHKTPPAPSSTPRSSRKGKGQPVQVVQLQGASSEGEQDDAPTSGAEQVEAVPA